MSGTVKVDDVLRVLESRPQSTDCDLVRRANALLASSIAPTRQRERALAASLLLAEFRADPECVAAALLVPVFTLEADKAALSVSEEVDSLARAATRLVAIRWNKIDAAAAETLRQMFLAMARDVRVVLIVLSLRVALMRCLSRQQALGDAHNDEVENIEAQRLAQETLDIFAPLANRLGVWQFKWELEDQALRVLEPDTYASIHECVIGAKDERQADVGEFVRELAGRFQEMGIVAKVSGRAKHIFSIVSKMRRKQLTFEQLFDVTAVRVIVDELPQCYAALGIVHSTWVPLPHEFDDYIAMPKANGYQSLHTVVMGPRGKPVEVQIRTWAMHEFAEYGVAAHWMYKEGRAKHEERFMVLRQLLDWEREVLEPEQFVQNLKTDLFEDQVFVFTRDGDVVALPNGATPLDFAYRIHSMVGHRCRGALVNEKLVPLDTKLRTGDRVAVLTHKLPQPSRDWLNPTFGYLHTSGARNKVRQWFRQQQREEAVAAGRELLTREFKRLNLRQVAFEDLAVALAYKGADDLCAAVGYGDRSGQSVSAAALQLERSETEPKRPQVPETAPESTSFGTARGLSLGGIGEIQGQRAGCCRPVPGDAVVGFVTRGRGLIIHRSNCLNVANSTEPERLVDIDWGASAQSQYGVELVVYAEDQPRMLAEVLNVISSFGIRVVAAKSEYVQKGSHAGDAKICLNLKCKSAAQVTLAIEKVVRHRGVLEVRRRVR